ncbi:MAG: hypothetical protein WB660_16690 [Candidatus Sulfotelmatobacter sp.]
MRLLVATDLYEVGNDFEKSEIGDVLQFCGKVCQEAYPIRLRNQQAQELVN